MSDEIKWKVEWRNSVYHATGNPERPCRFPSTGGLSIDRDNFADEPFDLARRGVKCCDRTFDLTPRITHGLCRFADYRFDEFLFSFFDPIRDLLQTGGSLKTGHLLYRICRDHRR